LKIRSILLLLTALVTTTAFANMSDPPSPRAGNITGDSYLRHLTMLREELVINMSDVNEGKPVRVRATYVIDCAELLKNIDLVFVANGLTESRYRVDLDGRFVNGYLTPYDAIPSSWLPPDSIKWFDKQIPFLYTHEGLISFRIDSLAPGKHTLIVDYDADASEWFTKDDLSVTRTFVYILKPTDNWKSFEKFRVVIFHPDNWEFFSNLELERVTPYSLSGSWATLPDRYLTIAIRKPPLETRIKSIVFQVISWAIFISLMLFWMTKVTRYRIRKNKWRILQIANSFVVSLLVPVFFLLVYFRNEALLDDWLDDHLNPTVTYGSGYLVLAYPVFWIISAIITFIADYFITRITKSRRKKSLPDKMFVQSEAVTK
jgi:hypothetical protein